MPSVPGRRGCGGIKNERGTIDSWGNEQEGGGKANRESFRGDASPAMGTGIELGNALRQEAAHETWKHGWGLREIEEHRRGRLGMVQEMGASEESLSLERVVYIRGIGIDACGGIFV